MEWQEGVIKRKPPHKNMEISLERNKFLKR